MKTLDDYKTFLAGVRRQTGLEALAAGRRGRLKGELSPRGV